MVSSPLRRARESAEHRGRSARRTYRVVEGLAEAGFGSWEGLTYAEVAERDPEAFAAWVTDPDQPAGGSGDSLTGTAERMAAHREQLVAEHPGRVVVARHPPHPDQAARAARPSRCR